MATNSPKSLVAKRCARRCAQRGLRRDRRLFLESLEPRLLLFHGPLHTLQLDGSDDYLRWVERSVGPRAAS